MLSNFWLKLQFFCLFFLLLMECRFFFKSLSLKYITMWRLNEENDILHKVVVNLEVVAKLNPRQKIVQVASVWITKKKGTLYRALIMIICIHGRLDVRWFILDTCNCLKKKRAEFCFLKGHDVVVNKMKEEDQQQEQLTDRNSNERTRKIRVARVTVGRKASVMVIRPWECNFSRTTPCCVNFDCGELVSPVRLIITFPSFPPILFFGSSPFSQHGCLLFSFKLHLFNFNVSQRILRIGNPYQKYDPLLDCCFLFIRQSLDQKYRILSDRRLSLKLSSAPISKFFFFFYNGKNLMGQFSGSKLEAQLTFFRAQCAIIRALKKKRTQPTNHIFKRYNNCCVEVYTVYERNRIYLEGINLLPGKTTRDSLVPSLTS